jgi:hypothetical protein
MLPLRSRRSRLRRVVGVVALALVAGFALTGCLPENGRLDEASLTTVTPSCRIASDVAPRLSQMLADAATLHVPLQPESKSYALVDPPRLTSCYRDYDMQVWWRDYWCFFGACEMAAVPGTSVHGWGRAVDFECAGEEMTFDSVCYAFVAYFGGAYGFFHPAWAEQGQPGAEAWHWEAS